MQKRLITWLGVALSAALLYWIATRFDLTDVADQMREAKIGWMVAGSAVYALLFSLRGLRWAILLRPVKTISAGTASEVFAIGFMANNILPARLGDVARAYVLARREGLPAAASFSSVMLERIVDGVTVVFFLQVVLLVAPPDVEWVRVIGAVAGAVFVGAIVVCALVAKNERFVASIAGRMLFFLSGRLMDRIYGLIGRLATGLHSLRSPARIVQIVLLSLLIWSAETSVYLLAANAFSIELTPLAGVLIMSMLTLGLTIPSGPGFVGVFERLIVESVALYGVVGPTALAYAVSVHIIHFVPGTLLGLVFSWRSGLRLAELRRAADTAPAAAATGEAPLAADAEIVAPVQEPER